MKTSNPKKGGPDLRREIDFLEAVRLRCPADIPTIKALAELYTQAGRYAEGLLADMELTRICPTESMVWYNLACSHAILNNKDDAFRALTQAVNLGYRDLSWMRQDKDLDSIRNDQRFRALLQRLKT